MLLPSNTRCRHPLMAASRWLCLALLVWHLACYAATAVPTVCAGLPSLVQSLGLLRFEPGSPAVAYLLAQLTVAMMLAALSRADLHTDDPEHVPSYDATAATAVEAGPLPSLHETIANYWHHGRRYDRSHDPGMSHQGAPVSATSGWVESAVESSSSHGSEGGLTPIRTTVGQASPSNIQPASLVRVSFLSIIPTYKCFEPVCDVLYRYIRMPCHAI